MRDLPGDKSPTRSGWMRCAIMRMFRVRVFSSSRGVSVPWTETRRIKSPEERWTGGLSGSVLCECRRDAGLVHCFHIRAGRLLMSQQDGES